METAQLVNLAFNLHPVDTVTVQDSTEQSYSVDRNEAARNAFLDGYKRGKENSKYTEAKTVGTLLELLKDLDTFKPLHPLRPASPYIFKEDYNRAYKKWAAKRKKIAALIPDLTT